MSTYDFCKRFVIGILRNRFQTWGEYENAIILTNANHSNRTYVVEFVIEYSSLAMIKTGSLREPFMRAYTYINFEIVLGGHNLTTAMNFVAEIMKPILSFSKSTLFHLFNPGSRRTKFLNTYRFNNGMSKLLENFKEKFQHQDSVWSFRNNLLLVNDIWIIEVPWNRPVLVLQNNYLYKKD